MYNNLSVEYYNWMCDIICEDSSQQAMYDSLLTYLYQKRFVAVLPQDENRIDDGINLRYRFSYAVGIPQSIIASSLDKNDCSVLEMLVALALRWEETIMRDSSQGDRTAIWFWTMIRNLEIDVTDEEFDIYNVEEIVDKFIDREYDFDGRGGLFCIDNCVYDMRNVEIWCQLNRWLATKL